MTLFLKLIITFAALAIFCGTLVFAIGKIYKATGNEPTVGIVRFVGLTAFVFVGSSFAFVVTVLCRLWDVL